MLFFTEVILLFAAVGIEGHARIDNPAPRVSGDAHVAACGATVTKYLEKDNTGPIEIAVSHADADYTCNAFLCRGYQYMDNTNNVMAVQVGDSLHFHINLVAGHKPGFANISVVDIATNTVITSLRTWDHWPDVTDDSTFDEKTQFNVTIPEELGSSCKTAGSCVMQWYWYAISNKQTFESCHDFYVLP